MQDATMHALLRTIVAFFAVCLASVASAQPLVVSERPSYDNRFLEATSHGAQGFVHLATGMLPPASKEPLDTLLTQAEHGEIKLAVTAPSPALPSKLRWLVLVGKSVPRDRLLTSPSTRTVGLVTAADLVGEGRAPEFVPGDFLTLNDLAWRIEATEAVKIRVLSAWGLLFGVALLVGVLAIRYPKLKALSRLCFALSAAGTLAQLVAALGATELVQIVLLAATTLILGTLAAVLHQTRALLALLALTITVDTLLHGGLVANAALSGYYASGIRFYGVGNEYMGLFIGAVLVCVPKKIELFLGMLTTLLLGLSMLGANAGGAMASSVAFLVLVNPRLLQKDKRLLFLGALLTAIGTALVLALIERLLPATARSHIGQAAVHGPRVWEEIIVRKLLMNARITVAGPTLLAIGAVLSVIWALTHGRIGARVTAMLAQEKELARRLPAAFWGAGAALAFNDSGTVAALLLLAPVVVTVIDRTVNHALSGD